MRSFRSFVPQWRRPVWVLLLVAAGVVFSFGLACATPFAALCAVAACTLPRRDAFCVAGAAWGVNQVIGFGFLHYPWTANCVAQGAAIGLSALLCTLVADGVSRRLIQRHALVSCAVAFAVAFAAYEAALAAFAVVLGGLDNFAPPIVAGIFGINVVAWVGFFALSWAGARIGVAPSSRPRVRITN
ncbi:MAG TPA: hypothetical protein VFW33_01190 [Gemmataceae bacterium]|nr:hypothetical protein [Gemmataceae bacterium]